MVVEPAVAEGTGAAPASDEGTGTQEVAQAATGTPAANTPPTPAADPHHGHAHHGHDHHGHDHHGHNHGPPPDPIVLADGECSGVTAEQIAAATAYTEVPADPTAIGSAMPAFALVDVQPLSCSHEQTYGMAPFRGNVTLVTLLSAGCGFCQAQISKLEQMRIELSLQGLDVNMVAINMGAQSTIANLLTARTSMPVFQDTAEANVWGVFQGQKDDMYVYNADHQLTALFRSGQEPDLNLSADTGYANVRGALLRAAGRE